MAVDLSHATFQRPIFGGREYVAQLDANDGIAAAATKVEADLPRLLDAIKTIGSPVRCGGQGAPVVGCPCAFCVMHAGALS